jgi:hypothetical protein
MPYTFYEEYSLGTLARLVMCRYARKYRRFLTGYPYAQSQGLMQVSPASVLSDLTRTVRLYSIHTGSNLIPGQVDITDPGTSVMLWDGMEMVPPVCPWQSIPIARLEYQSLSTQTQSWSCDVGMVRRSVGESRQ